MSCSSTKKTQETERHLTKSNYIANSSLFIDAKRAEFQGNEKEAERLLLEVLSKDPKNHAAAYELSRILGNNDNNRAIFYAEQAVKLNSINKWYLINLSNLYSLAGDYKKASKIAQKLVYLLPNDIQNYYRLVNIYTKDYDYNNALKTYYQIENKFGFDPQNVLRRKNILVQQKNYQKAAKEMEILIEKYPQEKSYYGMAADILMSDGKEKKAMEYYQKILEVDPQDGKVHMVLSSYYYSQKDKERSFQEMKLGFASPHLNVDDKIGVMMNLYKLTIANPDNQSLHNQADTLLLILSVTHPDDPKVLAMRGDFYAKNKEWDKALELYKKVIKIDSSKYLVWEQLILISKEKQDYKAMQNYSGRALLLFSQYPIIYYFHADANYHLGEYRMANASLNLGLSFVYKPQQKVEFYTFMGIVRDSLHQYKEAEVSFEKALLEVANYGPALKGYALHLLLVGNELGKAKAYAQKALELNLNSPEYIYVYAKVFFAEKNYPQALLWVEKGLKINPDDLLLNTLKGKILYQTGDKKKALIFLKKGEQE